MPVSPDTYYYPPRPENSCLIPQLQLFEAEGWQAQVKMDGTCGIFTVTSRGLHKGMTRHGPTKPFLRWSPTPAHSQALASLCAVPDAIYVFVGEVMHGRVNVPHLQHNPIYLHDVLVANGKSLTLQKYSDRLKLLQSLCGLPEPKPDDFDSHYVLSDHLWLARTYDTDFVKLYETLEKKRRWFPEYEGLVLKNPATRLAPCDRNGPNAAGQLKCRFPEDKDGILRRTS